MRNQSWSMVLFCLLASATPVIASQTGNAVSGEAVYARRCASCHEMDNARIPNRDALRNMPAARILRSLDFGIMITVAYPMRRDEREAVAAFLGFPGGDTGPPAKAYCADRTVRISTSAKAQWNGWSPAATNTRFQPADAAGLNPEQVGRLKLKWAFGFEGDVNAFAQPTVLGEHLFVGSAGGLVHGLNARTGCIDWVFQADGPVRSAILAVPQGARHALLFGDQTGWFYSVEAETGRLLWKKKVEDHEATRLTAAPVAHQGIVYVPVASWEESRALNQDYPCCTFRGSVVALRIRDGSQVWKTYMIPQKPRQTGKTSVGAERWGPSGAGIWGAATIDTRRGRLYVTTGDNYSSPATKTSDAIVALQLSNGRIVWTTQTTAGDAYNSSCGQKGPSCPEENGPDYDYGASAIMVRLSGGRDLLIAGQKSGIVYGIDPERMGQVIWQTRVGKGGINGGVQWGMASDGQNVYTAASDVIRTRRTPDPSDPIAVDLDPREGGGLTALHPENGSRVWYAPPVPCGERRGCSPAHSAAVTAIPGAVFAGSVDGHLRAFGAEDGRVVWDFNTVREYETVNGVPGRGGSLDGPGAVVAGGMVFVNSGYVRNGGTPGNVLLAFAPED